MQACACGRISQRIHNCNRAFEGNIVSTIRHDDLLSPSRNVNQLHLRLIHPNPVNAIKVLFTDTVAQGFVTVLPRSQQNERLIRSITSCLPLFGACADRFNPKAVFFGIWTRAGPRSAVPRRVCNGGSSVPRVLGDVLGISRHRNLRLDGHRSHGVFGGAEAFIGIHDLVPLHYFARVGRGPSHDGHQRSVGHVSPLR